MCLVMYICMSTWKFSELFIHFDKSEYVKLEMIIKTIFQCL